MLALNASHFRVAALPIIARAHNDRGDADDFKSMFGISADLTAVVWNICNFPAGTQPKHLVWALLLLKTYANEIHLIKMATNGSVCRKTFRKWVWIVIEAIAAQAPSVVSKCAAPVNSSNDPLTKKLFLLEKVRCIYSHYD